MEESTREKLEAAVRYHSGQSEWAKWGNRVEKLEQDVETYAFWAASEDIAAVCTGMNAAHAALALELQKARDHLATLSEFAPKKSKRSRG